MQYLPQQKNKEEMKAFLKKAHDLGNRVVVLDEFHKYQKSKSIDPEIEYFLKTFKHQNGSWIVISQSPLEIHDIVYHNMSHLFAFYMNLTSRHKKYYFEWFTKPLTRKLAELFFEVDKTQIRRPYIYMGKSSREPILYSHRGRFVVREDAQGRETVVELKGIKA